MNEDQVLAAFGALSNKMRLQVLRQLVEAGPDGLLAGQVAEALGASPSKMSFHLSALQEAGIVMSERQSRQIIYRVDFQAIGDVMRFLLQDCCKGNATVRQCCTGM
jgi:DNA-binding transcriptional ArsR family regulator